MRRVIDNARARLNWTAAYQAAPLALLLLAVATLFRVAVEVSEGDTLAWDQAVLLSLRHADDVALPLGPAWIGTAMVNYTSLGGVAVILPITLATQRVDALFLSVGVAGGWLCSNALKVWIARPPRTELPIWCPLAMLVFQVVTPWFPLQPIWHWQSSRPGFYMRQPRKHMYSLLLARSSAQ